MDARTQHTLELARENVTAARLSLMVALRHIGTGGPRPGAGARKIRAEVAASLASAATAERMFAEALFPCDRIILGREGGSLAAHPLVERGDGG